LPALGRIPVDGLGDRPERAQAVKQILSSRYFFWALLALPALPMMIALSSDPGAAEGLLHPSGEFSARFMIIAMMITPLRMIFPKASWLELADAAAPRAGRCSLSLCRPAPGSLRHG
jgi:hypothetical protein